MSPPEPSPLPPRLEPARRSAGRPGQSAVPLRLAVQRGVLGIELYQPLALGPLRVDELAFALPGLRFPVDLSGGVTAFRHRRGKLGRLTLALGLPELGRWARPRVMELLGHGTRLELWWVPEGIGVGLSGPDRALCFDIVFCPLLGDARFVIDRVRGEGLAGSVLGHALRILDSVLPRQFERRGRVVTVPSVAQHFVRALLPEVGVRAPAADDVRFGTVEERGDECVVTLDVSFLPAPTESRAAQALGLADLTREADDALTEGDPERARGLYLEVLDRAPRHPEVVRLIAEIDALTEDRAEAALGLLSESMPITHAGAFAARLLARAGDLQAARTTLEHALATEPYGPLCALGWARLAELEPEITDRLRALDRALARCPSLVAPRWARFELLLGVGDLDRSRSDAEHLEALAPTPSERHAACLRVADAYFEAGFTREALRFYERALRYVPDDAAALAGLGRSLRDTGRADRALSLLERAASLSEQSGAPDGRVLVDLAELVAGQYRDLPRAVAWLRKVPLGSGAVLRARYLEASYRRSLGDLAGASLCFARLRDSIELGARAEPPVAAWLREAAEHELDAHHDWMAAERHLAIALRVAPRDERVARAYRDVAAKLTELARRERQQS